MRAVASFVLRKFSEELSQVKLNKRLEGLKNHTKYTVHSFHFIVKRHFRKYFLLLLIILCLQTDCHL